MENKIRLGFTGLLKSPASWAKVSRELLTALARSERVKLSIKPCRGFLWSENFKLPSRLKNIVNRGFQPEEIDLQLAFGYPPALGSYDIKKPLWNFSVYEASHLPTNWSAPLNKYCEKIIVPTEYVKEVYQNSGVSEDKLIIVPYGYNPKNYKPKSNREEKISFLTVATPHFRKGLDLLENCAGLLKNHPLQWKVHSPYEPDGNSNYWEDPTVLDRLRKLGFEVSSGSLGEKETAALYRRADLVVQPSRSEGFGLAILEAMASGTGVIAPDYSGPLDFAGPGMVPISGELRPAKNCQYGKRNPSAKVFEPDKEHLQSELETLLQNPARLKKLGKKARQTVSKYTWDNSALQLLRLIEKENII
jgi:glycosyltransferase involved in cell wall biosynthesis